MQIYQWVVLVLHLLTWLAGSHSVGCKFTREVTCWEEMEGQRRRGGKHEIWGIGDIHLLCGGSERVWRVFVQRLNGGSWGIFGGWWRVLWGLTMRTQRATGMGQESRAKRLANSLSGRCEIWRQFRSNLPFGPSILFSCWNRWKRWRSGNGWMAAKKHQPHTMARKQGRNGCGEKLY